MCRDAGLTREELERAPAASAVRDLRATLHHLLQVWIQEHKNMALPYAQNCIVFWVWFITRKLYHEGIRAFKGLFLDHDLLFSSGRHLPPVHRG